MKRAAHILKAARAGNYAVPAFNAVNLETAQAIVRAAELEQSPVIVQISQNAARYAGLHLLAALGRTLCERASVPVVLHFDHARTVDSAREALEHGFDMVMLEGDDVKALCALADLAHGRGAALEAEFEVVAKGDRAETRADLDALSAFARETRCDALAVAIGSAHKQTQKTSHLDLERLAQIAAATELPLVLHGASGVVRDDLECAVAGGIAKVNVATELSLAFTKAVRGSLQDASLHDPRVYLGAGREAMIAQARDIMQALGSSGKAAPDQETVTA